MADTSDLANVERAVQQLKKNVSEEMEDTLKRNQGSAVKKVQMQAKRLIEANADVGKLGEKPEQQSLYKSFGSYVTKDVTSNGVSSTLVIGSTAPHAAALNEGTDPHEIAPSNKPELIFEGAPGDDYLLTNPGIAGVDREGGDNGGDLVTMEPGAPVNHPGVSKTSYFEISLQQLSEEIGDELNNNVRAAILESGFKPTTN